MNNINTMTDHELVTLYENGNAQRTDILRAMNRMSSMLYILMIREKSKKQIHEVK